MLNPADKLEVQEAFAGRRRRAVGYGELAVERAERGRLRRGQCVRQCRALRRHRALGGASDSRGGGGRGLAIAHRAASRAGGRPVRRTRPETRHGPEWILRRSAALAVDDIESG